MSSQLDAEGQNSSPAAGSPSQPGVDAAAFADRLELFFGETSDSLCRVYARLRGDEHQVGMRLTGTITGPECVYARTLPATIAFADRGIPNESAALVAEARVPEPCFWTPDAPYLYRVRVELHRDAELLAVADRLWGIRPLGVKGRSLVLNHKRWVVRGVCRAAALDAELADCHESGTAMLVRQPGDSLCQQASRDGVLIVAELSGDRQAIAGELARLARWPAVGIAVVDAAATMEIGGIARNMLLAQRFSSGAAIEPAAWAQIAFCELGDSLSEPQELRRRFEGCTLPIVVFRAAGGTPTIAEARSLCDRLQRDLARLGDFAGYIV